MNKVLMTVVTIAAVSLSACNGTMGNGTGMGNKELIGSGTGAVLGGFLGSKVGKGSGQLWATGAGALLGLAVGNSIGSSLDKADMAYAQQAEQKAYVAPVGRSITWNNPESGRSGTITPVREGKSSSGQYCRDDFLLPSNRY